MSPDLSLFRAIHALGAASGAASAASVFLAEWLPYFLLGLFVIFAVLFLRREKGAIRARVAIASALAASLVARFLFASGIRMFWERPRPYVADSSVMPLVPSDGWSFPSGHASFFFALAAAVYCYDRRWGTALFIGAIGNGVGRVAAGVHYPLDIAGGAVVGIVAAAIVWFFARRLERSPESGG